MTEFKNDFHIYPEKAAYDVEVAQRLASLEKKVDALIQEVQSLKPKQSVADCASAQCKLSYKVDVELICKDRLVKFQNLESDNLISLCKEVVRAYNIQRPNVIVKNVRVNGEWFTSLFKISYDGYNIYVDEVIE